MEDCIFCKIIAGEIPCVKVYEDDYTFAFLDIAPVNYGHTLVISKKHFQNMEDAEEEYLCAMIKTMKKIGRAIKEGLGVKGYNISENNDPLSGQKVPHIHFHVIPRVEGDGISLWPQGEYAEGEIEATAEKIKNIIS